MTDTGTKLSVRTDATAPAATIGAPEWSIFTDLRREMDRLLEDFGRGWFGDVTRLIPPALDTMLRSDARFDLRPAVDLVEKDGAWSITAEMPGLDDEAIEVAIVDDVLTQKGEKTVTREDDEKGRHVSERRYGSFARSFRLPEGIDRDRIEASYAGGVLTVTPPKRAVEAPQAKKIEVKAA